MPRNKGYEIIDEPSLGRFPGLVVSPTFPMFAFMLGGSAVGFAWFAVNAFAFGSATRKRELALAVLTPVLVTVVLVGASLLLMNRAIPATFLPYIGVLGTLIKVSAAYLIFVRQRVSYELYVHFGGATKNGVLALVGAILVSRNVLEQMPDFVRAVLQ